MGCECVTSPGHGELVMGKIQVLWREQMLSDYTLVAEGRIFKVHKIVLASLSEYFQASFRSGMLEGVRDRHELKGVSAASLSLILDFFYTGSLSLTPDNVSEVLASAVFLQSDSVVAKCCRYLEGNICVENYPDIRTLAEMYHVTELYSVLSDFRLKHFSKFAKSALFLELTLAELTTLLKEDGLRCSSEYKLYKLVVRWVKHRAAERGSHMCGLLQYVRFPHMSGEELRQVRKNPCVAGEAACRAYLDEAAQYQASPGEQVLCHFPRSVPRAAEYIVSLGCTDVAMHSCVLYKGRWHTLEGALGQPRPFVGASACVVNNHLFVCGGHVGADSPPSRACYCFRPTDSRWTRLESMNVHRRNFAMVADGDAGLVVFGGVTTDDHVTNTVERYSIRDRVWTPQPGMARELADLAGCVRGDAVFLAGGVDENCLHCSEFRAYHPHSATWSRLPDILRIKFRPRLFAAGSALYLADLYRTDGGSAQLERYDPAALQWTVLELPRVQFSRNFGAAVVGKWLYFVGKNDVEEGTCKKVNLRTGEVVDASTYPFAADAPLCSVLKLPQKFIKAKMLARES